MNKVKCANGHFYDADRFQSCPICGSDTAVVIEKGASKRTTMDELAKTEPLLPSTEIREAPSWQEEPSGRKVDELAPTALIREEDERRLEAGIASERGALTPGPDADAQENNAAPIAQRHHETTASPLKAAVEQTGAQRISALPKTVSYYDMEENEPPVGWLVCIKGPYRGRAYECHVGRNRIGRSPELELCLPEDTAVTREPHAILIYEPRQRSFYLQAGTGDGLAYLNGSVLFSHEELHAYDRLALGGSEFVFLPLCGDRFSWEDCIEEEGAFR